ncbi:hypothetical protein Tsp_03719 [Trichinella spiralis]|uniref:hypothetical protein n=1 Tax=Trichinella spiralis TaxID=6334 RepID=UPI0001EFBB06|nr:hypothetical protein Tsp_03719 [Trichinella spiralis]
MLDKPDSIAEFFNIKIKLLPYSLFTEKRDFQIKSDNSNVHFPLLVVEQKNRLKLKTFDAMLLIQYIVISRFGVFLILYTFHQSEVWFGVGEVDFRDGDLTI